MNQHDKATPSARTTTRIGIIRSILRLPFMVLLSLMCLVGLIVVALGADWIAPFDYQAIDLRGRLIPPFWIEGGNLDHLLGTDDLGRDMLSRLIFSVRMSLFVALLGTVIGAVFGTTLGFLAAHFRGWVDDVVMAAIDFQAALPFMILALAVVATLGNSLVLFIGLMGIYGWERYARLTRGLTLSAVTHGYAVAVRTLGAGPLRIYGRHILPNIANALIVNMTLNFPQTILLETSLSFLGLGIQPPLTSLGNMVGFGRDYLLTAWWIAVFPALAIFIATLAMSILGDWVRDRLDPTLKT
jgi:peptide/nickel transport system permease protein